MPRPGEDPNLRSTQAVTGFAVKASDGLIGSVNGLMINGRDWTIRELIVKAAPGFGDRRSSCSPRRSGLIGYAEAVVHLKLTQDAIRQMVGARAAAT